MGAIQKRFFSPVDNSPLVLFRIIYGFLLMAEAWGAIATGWVRRVFIEPKINFPFIDLSFLEPLDGNGMIYYYALLGLFGLMVMLGFKYRMAIIAYSLMWAAVYFMQKTSYNNHYYLMCWFNFLFCFMPANAFASIDAKIKKKKSNHCAQWCLDIFKALILIVYFYAAVAKMYPAWIEAVPTKIWFEAKSNYWLIGPILKYSWMPFLVAWGGLLFDLLIGPAMLWKKSRNLAFFISIFFHLFNSWVFQVGVFPYMGIAFAIFFYEPDFIRRRFFPKKAPLGKNIDTIRVKFASIRSAVIVGIIILHILLPLRHHLYTGNVNWTEEGHRLSWRMMLRVKSGWVHIKVVDNQTKLYEYVVLEEYLSAKQIKRIAIRPDMMWQFIQHLKEDHKLRGKEDISIYVNGLVVLNDADPRPLYDPKYDMVKAEWNKYEESDWLIRYPKSSL